MYAARDNHFRESAAAKCAIPSTERTQAGVDVKTYAQNTEFMHKFSKYKLTDK